MTRTPNDRNIVDYYGPPTYVKNHHAIRLQRRLVHVVVARLRCRTRPHVWVGPVCAHTVVLGGSSSAVILGSYRKKKNST